MIRLVQNDKRIEELYEAIEKVACEKAMELGLHYATIIGVLKLIMHNIEHETME